MPLRAEGTLIVATSEDEASDNVSEVYAVHFGVFSRFPARTNSVRMGLRSPLSLTSICITRMADKSAVLKTVSMSFPHLQFASLVDIFIRCASDLCTA